MRRCLDHDDDTGWDINNLRCIIKTEDGGQSWTEQKSLPGLYLRCVAFTDAEVGWVGATAGNSPNDRLHHTLDGGATWNPITNLPAGSPDRICGLWVVDRNTVYAYGTNEPMEPTAFIKTLDGGQSWMRST